MPRNTKAFVAAFATLRAEAALRGAKVIFVDEAHFRADVELRTKWVLRGEPDLVAASSLKFGTKATLYSAVCLDVNCHAENGMNIVAIIDARLRSIAVEYAGIAYGSRLLPRLHLARKGNQ